METCHVPLLKSVMRMWQVLPLMPTRHWNHLVALVAFAAAAVWSMRSMMAPSGLKVAPKSCCQHLQLQWMQTNAGCNLAHVSNVGCQKDYAVVLNQQHPLGRLERRRQEAPRWMLQWTTKLSNESRSKTLLVTMSWQASMCSDVIKSALLRQWG